MLGNTFGAILFESSKILLANIRKFNRNRRNIERMNVFHCKRYEIFHKAWMFCYSEFCHDASIHTSDSWRVIWKNIFSTVDPSHNELWRWHGILFDIIMVQKLRFSHFLYFLILCLLSSQLVIVLKFPFKSFDCMVAILQRSNKWSRTKYLVRTQISVHGSFIF